MLESLRQRETEASETSTVIGGRPERQAIAETLPVRLGRFVYGGILAFMAADGLRNADERIQYAKAKNVPMPAIANYLAHGLLLMGGLGITLWRAPRLAASAIVAFFLGVTPFMHDFWNIDDPEQKQQQMIQFLKNTALLGTALVFLETARRSR